MATAVQFSNGLYAVYVGSGCFLNLKDNKSLEDEESQVLSHCTKTELGPIIQALKVFHGERHFDITKFKRVS